MSFGLKSKIKESLSGNFRRISSDEKAKPLSLSGQGLSVLPAGSVTKKKNYTDVDLSENLFTRVPLELSFISSTLVSLNLDDNIRISTFKGLSCLTELIQLSLCRCDLKKVPQEIFHCSSLRRLVLQQNKLSILPESFTCLQKLEVIKLSRNSILHLPGFLLELPNLQRVGLEFNAISKSGIHLSFFSEFPSNLSVVSLVGNPVAREYAENLFKLLSEYPRALFSLVGSGGKSAILHSLSVSVFSSVNVPKTVFNLVWTDSDLVDSDCTVLCQTLDAISRLDLSCNRLQAPFPRLKSLAATLFFVSLSKNNLNSLTGIDVFRNLNELVVSGNISLTRIGPEIGGLSSLRSFFASSCAIETVSPEIRHCTNLELIDLGHNPGLAPLPAAFYECTQVRTLVLAGSGTASLLQPAVTRLEKLTKLSISYFDFSPILFSLKLTAGGCTVTGRYAEALQRLSNSFFSSAAAASELDWSSLPLADTFFTLACYHKRLTRLVIEKSTPALTVIPIEIGELVNLRELRLRDNKLTQLSTQIGMLSQLEILDVFQNEIKTLPNTLSMCSSLKVLELGRNPLHFLPGGLTNLRCLREISSPIPDTLIFSLKRLNRLELDGAVSLVIRRIFSVWLKRESDLNLSNSDLASAPSYLFFCTQLRSLSLAGNFLATIPNELGNLRLLTRLDVAANRLELLPDQLGELVGLIQLNLAGNSLQSLPVTVSRLTRLRTLDIGGSSLLGRAPDGLAMCHSLSTVRLSVVGDFLFKLTQIQSLQLTLDVPQDSAILAQAFVRRSQILTSLAGLNLSSLSMHIGGLKLSLRVLDVSNNRLRTLPEATGSLVSLIELTAANNLIEVVGDWIGKLTRLQVLNLYKNRLREVPDSICANVNSLVSLNLSENPLQKLPRGLELMLNLAEISLPTADVSIFKLPSLKTIHVDLVTKEISRVHHCFVKKETWLDVSNLGLDRCAPHLASMQHLRHLNLAYNSLRELPYEIGSLIHLVSLSARHNRINLVTDQLSNLTSLEYLDLSCNELRASSLPMLSCLANSLTSVRLAGNKLMADACSLPESLGALTNLVELTLPCAAPIVFQLRHRATRLSRLTLDKDAPELDSRALGCLLRREVALNLSNLSLDSVRPMLGGLFAHLTKITLAGNRLRAFPDDIGHLSKLQELDASCNSISSLPVGLTRLQALKLCNLSNNCLTSFPDFICTSLTELRKLNLIGNDNLVHLPESFSSLQSLAELYSPVESRCLYFLAGLVKIIFDNVKVPPATQLLFASFINKDREVDLSALNVCPAQPITANIDLLAPWLTGLILDKNPNLDELPSSFVDLHNLGTFSACNCGLVRLPMGFSRLTSLKKLLLVGNRLSNIDEEVCLLPNLELFHLAENTRLSVLPKSLPNLASSLVDFSTPAAPLSIFLLTRLTMLSLDDRCGRDVQLVCDVWLQKRSLLCLDQMPLGMLCPHVGYLGHFLRTLSLVGTDIGPRMPKIISKLTCLEKLNISSCTRLKSLDFHVMEPLSESLTVIVASKSAIQSFASFAALKKLISLDVSYASSSLADIDSLGALRQLTSLRELMTGVVDESLFALPYLESVTFDKSVVASSVQIVNSYLKRTPVLDLADCSMPNCPSIIGGLSEFLVSLNLHGNALLTLPKAVGRLLALQSLVISNNKLTSLPLEICHCSSLQTLDASHNGLTRVPDNLLFLPALHQIILRGNRLVRLPDRVSKSMSTLDLSFNPELENVPAGLLELSSQMKLLRLPTVYDILFQFPRLGFVRIDKSAPAAFYACLAAFVKKSKDFSLKATGLVCVPRFLRYLSLITRVDLSHNRLTCVCGIDGNHSCVELQSESIWSGLDNLTLVNVSNNRLTSLSALAFVPRLAHLDVRSNELPSLGSVLAMSSCVASSLVQIDATGSGASHFGVSDLSHCKRLVKLNVDFVDPALFTLPGNTSHHRTIELSSHVRSNVERAVVDAWTNKKSALNMTNFGIADSMMGNAGVFGSSIVPCAATLTELNLCGNHLTQIPACLSSLVQLRRLDISKNCLLNLDMTDWSALSSLEYLNLTNNDDASGPVPGAWQHLRNLKILLLADTPVEPLPIQFADLFSRIHSISVSRPTPVLFALLSLKKVLLDSSDRFDDAFRLICDSFLLKKTELTLAQFGLESKTASFLKFQTHLTSLDLSVNSLVASDLTGVFNPLVALEKLSLAENFLAEVPPDVLGLPKLNWLSLEGNSISSLPENFGRLSLLKHLNIQRNPILCLPPTFTQLMHLNEIVTGILDAGCFDLPLQSITCESTVPSAVKVVVQAFLSRSDAVSFASVQGLRSIPAQITGLGDFLSTLDVSGTMIDCISPLVGQLRLLTSLIASNCHSLTLIEPYALYSLTGLKQLILSNCRLSKLPHLQSLHDCLVELRLDSNPFKVEILSDPSVGLTSLTSLTTLILDRPHAILFKMSRLTRLELLDQRLLETERMIHYNFVSRSTSLQLTRQSLSIWPENLSWLNTHLMVLCLDDNPLSFVPDSIGMLSQLVKLSLNGCPVSEISASIGKLTLLRELNLSRCRLLHDLPSSLVSLKRLSKCSASKPYMVLFELGSLMTPLGNFSRGGPSASSLREVAWDRVDPFYHAVWDALLRDRLSLRGFGLNFVPEQIQYCMYLVELKLDKNNLTELPTSLCKLTRLKILSLSNNKLTCIDNLLGNAGFANSLTCLNAPSNLLTSLENLGLFTRLQQLHLMDNPDLTSPILGLASLTLLEDLSLPFTDRQVIKLTRLKSLRYSGAHSSEMLCYNAFRDQKKFLEINSLQKSDRIPFHLTDCIFLTELMFQSLDERVLLSKLNLSELSTLVHLKRLVCAHVGLDTITATVDGDKLLPSLIELDLTSNKVSNASALVHLTSLEVLLLSGNQQLESLPDLGRLQQLTKLTSSVADPVLFACPHLVSVSLDESTVSFDDITICQAFVLKRAIFDLSARSLRTSPPLLFELGKCLRRLVLSNNSLVALPDALSKLQSLELLLVNNNQIAGISSVGLGSLCCLHTLMMESNKITSIPDSLGNLTALETLCLKDNPIAFLPDSVKLLTRLTRVSIGSAGQSAHLFSLPNLNQLTLDSSAPAWLPRAWHAKQSKTIVSLELNQELLGFQQLPACLSFLPPGSVSHLSVRTNELDSFGTGIESIQSRLLLLDAGENCLTSLQGLSLLPCALTVNLDSNDLDESVLHSLSTATRLQNLNLSNNLRLKKLPDSFFMLHDLFELRIDNCSLECLPTEFVYPPNLSIFSACKNQLSFLPDALFALVGLKEVNFSSNLLTTLPRGLRHLHKLSILRLASNRINSVPAELGRLAQLTVLDLSDNEIHPFLTPAIGKCTKISVLSLSGNLLLAAIPPSLSLCTKLEFLDVRNCPKLSSPPTALLGDPAKPQSALGFLKDLAESGTVLCNRLKLVLVGEENVGKTMLLRCLREVSKSEVFLKKRVRRVWQKKPLSTDGIDISELVVPGAGPSSSSTSLLSGWSAQQSNLELTVYDFAGQELYYSSHSFFLSSGALYLLVFNIAQPVFETRLEYWLQGLAARVSSPDVILVATHLDMVESADQVNETLNALLQRLGPRFPNIVRSDRVFAVSCKDGAYLPTLKSAIVDMACASPLFGTAMPKSYVALEQQVLNLRSRLRPPLITLKQLARVAVDCFILQPDALRRASDFLHKMGTIICFNEESGVSKAVQNLIVLDPQYLAKLMAAVVSTKHRFATGGLLTHSNLDQIWRAPDFPSSHHEIFLDLMNKYGIAIALTPRIPGSPHLGSSLIPAMLPRREPRPLRAWVDRIVLRPSRMLFGGAAGSSAGGHTRSSRSGAGLEVSWWDVCGGVEADVLLDGPLPPPGGVGGLTRLAEWQRRRWESMRRRWIIPFIPCDLLARLLQKLLQFMRPLELWQTGAVLLAADGCLLLRIGLLNEGDEAAAAQKEQNMVDITVCGATPARLMRIASSSMDSLTRIWYKFDSSKLIHYCVCPHCLQISDDPADPNLVCDLFLFSECFRLASSGEQTINCQRGWCRTPLQKVVPDIFRSDLHRFRWKDFEHISELGRGSFAVVSKARFGTGETSTRTGAGKRASKHTDRATGGPMNREFVVAVKRLVDSSEFSEFLSEVEVMSYFRHPNLIQLIGMIISPPAIVLEYADGGSLDHFLASSLEIEWPLRYRIALDVARGLAFLHTSFPPVIHRDLKSANVLLVSKSPKKNDGVVAKVADFGLSVMGPETFEAGQSALNPRWLAPELLQGGQNMQSTSADVYAYGILCWELCARELPFSGERDPRYKWNVQVEKDVCKGIRPKIPVDCPKPMYRLIKSCWSPAKELRPSIIRAVLLFEQELELPPLNTHPAEMTQENDILLHRSVAPVDLDARSRIYVSLEGLNQKISHGKRAFLRSTVWVRDGDAKLTSRKIASAFRRPKWKKMYLRELAWPRPTMFFLNSSDDDVFDDDDEKSSFTALEERCVRSLSFEAIVSVEGPDLSKVAGAAAAASADATQATAEFTLTTSDRRSIFIRTMSPSETDLWISCIRRYLLHRERSRRRNTGGHDGVSMRFVEKLSMHREERSSKDSNDGAAAVDDLVSNQAGSSSSQSVFRCMNGHPVDPDDETCRVCGEVLYTTPVEEIEYDLNNRTKSVRTEGTMELLKQLDESGAASSEEATHTMNTMDLVLQENEESVSTVSHQNPQYVDLNLVARNPKKENIYDKV